MELKNTKVREQAEKLRTKVKAPLENEKLRGILRWIFEIAVTLVFAAVVAIFLFQTVTMQESAMEPTISVGDQYLMNRFSYKIGSPERGDIIVFKNNSSDDAALHIRRVIGLPGEVIQIKNGQILINGEVYAEGDAFPTITSAGLATNPVSLEAGEYFVLGDNRNNSEDSRYSDIGKVKKKYIIGKLWFAVSPVNKIGFLKD